MIFMEWNYHIFFISKIIIQEIRKCKKKTKKTPKNKTRYWPITLAATCKSLTTNPSPFQEEKKLLFNFAFLQHIFLTKKNTDSIMYVGF